MKLGQLRRGSHLDRNIRPGAVPVLHRFPHLQLALRVRVHKYESDARVQSGPMLCEEGFSMKSRISEVPVSLHIALEAG